MNSWFYVWLCFVIFSSNHLTAACGGRLRLLFGAYILRSAHARSLSASPTRCCSGFVWCHKLAWRLNLFENCFFKRINSFHSSSPPSKEDTSLPSFQSFNFPLLYFVYRSMTRYDSHRQMSATGSWNAAMPRETTKIRKLFSTTSWWPMHCWERYRSKVSIATVSHRTATQCPIHHPKVSLKFENMQSCQLWWIFFLLICVQLFGASWRQSFLRWPK